MSGADGGGDSGLGGGLFSKRRKALLDRVEDNLVPMLTDPLVDRGFGRRQTPGQCSGLLLHSGRWEQI